MNKDLIAITIGDIEGIGIHLLLNEFQKNNIKKFILITNINVFKNQFKYPIKKLNIFKFDDIYNFKYNKLNIITYETKNKYTNTLDSLKIAYDLTKKKYFKGILTLPLNKKKVNTYVNNKFIDQTSFFSGLEKSKHSNMFFVFKNKFFVPLTIHIEIKNVFNEFSDKEKMINKIISIEETLKKDFKIKKPKIIMAGINPHAGENGMISLDEANYLKPIINDSRIKKLNITGPISGDGMVNDYNLSIYDAFIFTFHDQALIPFKLISKYKGVNFTSNLNIIRTSPSHGTAENLIGSKYATSEGILNSFKLINKISKNRNQN